MNTCADISAKYKSALLNYLNGGGEAALQTAYELGRRAVAEELGTIDLVNIHREALMSALHNGQSIEDFLRVTHSSWQFLFESLSPFEMTIRGFQEAITKLQVSDQRYRTLIDTAQDVIYTLSTDGTIKSLNAAFEDITGFTRSEWIGRPFADIVHPEDLRFAMTIYQRVLNNEIPPVFELRVRNKAGFFLIGEFTTTPEIYNGSVVGTFGIARDITERRRAQEQLRALAKRVVDAQEEERRHIARELHDDLCQWLSGMKLSLDLLQEQIPDERPLQTKLRGLKQQVNQRIIEVRRMSVHLRPSALDDFGLVVALSRLCEDIERMHKIQIVFQTKGTVLEHYSPEVDIALYRITQEGLSNIVKHSNAERAEVLVSHLGNTVSLHIEDNGIGFEPSNLATMKTPGQHLGIVSMRERATLLGGTVNVASRLARGTSIHVDIPLVPN